MTVESGRVRRALEGDESVLSTRVIALDDIHIRAGGTGGVVTDYASVWMSPTQIMDSDGHYMEQNAPTSMDRSIAERAGQIFSVYNHAKTLSGTPSEMHSVPIGKPIEIRADKRGLLTVTRYNKDPAAEQVLEAIRSGSLTGMSYTGVFLRSDPELSSRFAQYEPDRNGDLTLVTRQEIALIEYGPTPRPAYADAAILGVRNKKAAQVDDEQPEREVITMTTPSPANVTITGNTFTGTGLTLTRTETAQEAPEVTEADPQPPEAERVIEVTTEAPAERLDTTTAAAAIAHEGSDRASVDTSTWDAGAAMAACDTGSEYSAICAGRKSGPPDQRSSWALPHHKSPGAPPNAAAVRNALARLSQTEGLTNQAAARKHLEAHMSAVSTSSSGRDPAPETTRTEPHQHSAATHTTRSNPVDPTERTTMTIEERVARQSEVRVRLAEIDSEYAGAELTAEARAEWSDLQQELIQNERAIADASQRADYLRQVADLMPSATEQIDNGQVGFVQPGIPTLPNRYGIGGPAFIRQENIYDLQAIRQRARNIDEVPILMREYALRAVEQSRFPSASGRGGAPNREDAQGRVANLLETIDDEHGNLARRVLVTGSSLYDRAFGKMLARQSMHGLTAEESRALQLGTDASGGFAVPFQLDPTVILTSVAAVNPLRAISRVETITGKEWDGLTSLGVTVARGTESQEVGTGDPVFAQPTVKTSRVMGWIPFSIELDISWNAMRAQMTNLLQDAKDIEEATAFATGNGTAPNPSGVISTLGTASRVTSGGSAVVQAADVYLLENAMNPRFITNSSILASKTIFNKFRTAFASAASAAGDPFVRPSGGMPGTLNGYPMYELSTMSATAGTADLVMLQGDFSQFLIVDRVGMGIELVPQLLGTNRRPTGERGVFALWFNNSKILTDAAFRLLQIKAT